MRIIAIAICVLAALYCSLAQAGYEQPCFIDGCRTVDGRFEITAEPVGKTTNHGPNKWQFVWRDTKENKTVRLDANDVQGGQIHAHLFIAPDGETFALSSQSTRFGLEPRGWSPSRLRSRCQLKVCLREGS